MEMREKKKFYKEYIQIHEKLISRFVAAVISDVFFDHHIVQRIMHRAFLEADQVDAKSDILNWLYIIACDEIIKTYKKKNKDYSFEYGETKNKINIHTITQWLLYEIDTTFFAKLDRLFFRNKLIILMRYLANLRKSDIAELLNIDKDKIEDVLYDSLIKLTGILDGDPDLIVEMAELNEWTDFPEFREDDEDEDMKLSPEDKLLDDMLRFQVPRMYRENPHLLAISFGKSTTLIGTREFTNDEKMICEKIGEYGEKIPQQSNLNGCGKLIQKVFERVHASGEAAIRDDYELDSKTYNEMKNLLKEGEQRIKE